MALPVIQFNSSTGSDTAASGAGPATAITGTAAAHTGGSASTTVTLTNSPDLSGVITILSNSANPNPVLWMKTASGRQSSMITAADNTAKTVTVEDSFTIAAASAVNYAIGGVRATLANADSLTLFGATGVKAGWVIELAAGDTQTISAAIALAVSGNTTNGYITLRGASASSRATIVQSADANTFSVGNFDYWKFENLICVNSAATKVNAIAFNCRIVTSMIWKNCILGDSTNRLLYGFARTAGIDATVQFIDCEIKYCTGWGLYIAGFAAKIAGCSIHHNGGGGIVDIRKGSTVEDCAIWANTGDAINSLTGECTIRNCTISANTGDGIELGGNGPWHIYNNNITANGAYGIRGATGADWLKALIDYNNFGTGALANTSGARLNLTAGANDLAVDPQYTNAATGNFAIGNTAALAAAGFKSSYIGAVPASGGSSTSADAIIQAEGGNYVEAAVADVRSGTSYGAGAYVKTGTMVVGGSTVIVVED